MPFYIYIIANETNSDLYKGFTENPVKRLEQHNNKESKFTSNKQNWQLIGLFQFDTKTEALVFEKKIKRWNKIALRKLISDNKNIATTFKGEVD